MKPILIIGQKCSGKSRFAREMATFRNHHLSVLNGRDFIHSADFISSLDYSVSRISPMTKTLLIDDLDPASLIGVLTYFSPNKLEVIRIGHSPVVISTPQLIITSEATVHELNLPTSWRVGVTLLESSMSPNGTILLKVHEALRRSSNAEKEVGDNE